MNSVSSLQPDVLHAALSDEFIRGQVAKHKWFIDVDFGNGIVAQSSSWPDAPPNSPHVGVPKFEFIVRRNLPSLAGARILEFGCNCGVIALHMLHEGASEVVGVDSDSTWEGWQSQAQLVKAVFESRWKTTCNVRYIDSDIAAVPSMDLGRFDAVMALNCLYYLSEEDIARVIRHVSTISDVFLIQCNTRDHPALGRRPTPRFMAAALQANGFPVTHIDAPWDKPRRGIIPQKYSRPVVVGRKQS
jgi:2-polyprenyl-3-methyl-5-hydroxy-6-metoxy-1,4-benzoquinol methylase